MIEIRIYRDTDPACPKARRFLALCTTGRVSVTVVGETKRAAQAKADAWLEAARKPRADRTRDTE